MVSQPAFSHVGPPLDAGPKPTFFYFSLSGHDSLHLGPFNTPIERLKKHPIHAVSVDLPAHENGADPTAAIAKWAEMMERGEDPLQECLDRALWVLEYLIAEGITDPNKIAAGGLSRGGFMATHLAARDHRIKSVLGFAPMSDLAVSEHFTPIAQRPEVEQYALVHLAPRLIHTKLRYYIANRDTLVDTDKCYQFTKTVVDAALTERIRSPHVELFLTPPIGHKGHGTSQWAFEHGADWIANQLLPHE